MINNQLSPSSESTDSLQTPQYQQTFHQGKKAFQCLAVGCGKIFRFKSDMERHTVVHSNEKPCVCTFPKCKRSFKRPDALKNHLQAHTDNKIFVCPIADCNAQFHKKTILQYHLIKHQILENYNASCVREERPIASPFKRVQKWEKKFYAQKHVSAQDFTKDNQSLFSNEEFKNRDIESENLSYSDEEEDEIYQPVNQNQTAEQVNLYKHESFSSQSKDLSEPYLSPQSSVNNATPAGSFAQAFLESVCTQLDRENEELRIQLAEKLQLLQQKRQEENYFRFMASEAMEFRPESEGQGSSIFQNILN